MGISATVLGQVILAWVVIATILTYFLAKRKTQTPIMATVVGFLIAFIPPLSMIYIIALILKNDINTNDASQQSTL